MYAIATKNAAYLEHSQPPAPAQRTEVFEAETDDEISDADLPALPTEHYNSVWEAILAHL